MTADQYRETAAKLIAGLGRAGAELAEVNRLARILMAGPPRDVPPGDAKRTDAELKAARLKFQRVAAGK